MIITFKRIKSLFLGLSIYTDICNVNFFSHYYFDKLENNPIHNFGLLTPDLLRNFTPNLYDKKKIHLETLAEDWKMGIHQHISRDQSFHNSEFFKAVYNESHESVKSCFQTLGIPRYWFALHVWIEMLLDKVLIQENTEELHQFYDELNQIKNHIPDLLQQIDHQNIEQFQHRMNRFLESKYLFHYKEHSGIIYGLNRVYIQVKASTVEWNSDQRDALIIESQKLENSIFKNFHHLLT